MGKLPATRLLRVILGAALAFGVAAAMIGGGSWDGVAMSVGDVDALRGALADTQVRVVSLTRDILLSGSNFTTIDIATPSVTIDGSACANGRCRLCGASGSCYLPPARRHGQPFFRIESEGASYALTFQSVELCNACVGSPLGLFEGAQGGGVLFISNNGSIPQSTVPTFHLAFVDSWVHNNKVNTDGGVVKAVRLDADNAFRLAVRVGGNSLFQENSATRCGGVFAADAPISVNVTDAAAFYDNSVAMGALSAEALSNGGVVYTPYSMLMYAYGDVVFAGNLAGNGGVAFAGGELTFSATDDASFRNNQAFVYGGVIGAGEEAFVTLSGQASFQNNSATVGGGVVYTTTDLHLRAYDTATFLNNSAPNSAVNGSVQGGVAAAFRVANLQLHGNINFLGNSARDSGGVFFAREALQANITGLATFSDNSAQLGALFATRVGDLSVSILEGCDLSGNVAYSNGVVAHSDSGALNLFSQGLLINNAVRASDPLPLNAALFSLGLSEASPEGANATVSDPQLCNSATMINTHIEDSHVYLFDLASTSGIRGHFLGLLLVDSSFDGAGVLTPTANTAHSSSEIEDPETATTLCYSRGRVDGFASLSCSPLCEGAASVLLYGAAPLDVRADLAGESLPATQLLITKQVFFPRIGQQDTCAEVVVQSPHPKAASTQSQCPSTSLYLQCAGLREADGSTNSISGWAWALLAGCASCVVILALVVGIYVRKSVALVRGSYALLCNAIPEPIARRLRRGEVIQEYVDDVVPIFGDIVGYTSWSAGRGSDEIIGVLDELFIVFDRICDECGLLKVKTIGDCYMCVAGCLPQRQGQGARYDRATLNLLRGTVFAWRCIEALWDYQRERLGVVVGRQRDRQSTCAGTGSCVEGQAVGGGERILKMRFGLCCGPAATGVIGTERLQFDLWGDTVNTASRMESTSDVNHLQLPADDAQRLAAAFPGEFVFGPAKVVDVKGKGSMECCLLLDMRMGPEEQRELMHVPRAGRTLSNNLSTSGSHAGSTMPFPSSGTPHSGDERPSSRTWLARLSWSLLASLRVAVPHQSPKPQVPALSRACMSLLQLEEEQRKGHTARRQAARSSHRSRPNMPRPGPSWLAWFGRLRCWGRAEARSHAPALDPVEAADEHDYYVDLIDDGPSHSTPRTALLTVMASASMALLVLSGAGQAHLSGPPIKDAPGLEPQSRGGATPESGPFHPEAASLVPLSALDPFEEEPIESQALYPASIGGCALDGKVASVDDLRDALESGCPTITLLADIDLLDEPSLQVYNDVRLDGSQCVDGVCAISTSHTVGCGWGFQLGNRLAFSPQGARDPFFVAAADNLQITLSSVEVHSACVDGDGAVLSSTFHRLDVVLQDAHLHDNHAAQTGAAIFCAYELTVFARGQTLLSSNFALFGGAFASVHTNLLAADHSAFLNNSASTGGGVLVARGHPTPQMTLDVTDSVIFQGNAAYSYHGGVAYSFGELSVSASGQATFLENAARVEGGVFYGYLAVGINATGDVVVRDNTASNSGGVVASDYGDIRLQCTNQVAFANNTAHFGAVLYSWQHSVWLDVQGQCTFADNVAEGHGGVACGRSMVHATTIGGAFLHNYAYHGGLFFSNQDSALSLIGSLIRGNTVEGEGVLAYVVNGGLSLYAGNLTLDTASNHALSAGGSLFFEEYDVGGDNDGFDAFGALCHSAVLEGAHVLGDENDNTPSGTTLFDLQGSLWLVLTDSELALSPWQLVNSSAASVDCFVDSRTVFSALDQSWAADAAHVCQPVCLGAQQAVLEMWQPGYRQVTLHDTPPSSAGAQITTKETVLPMAGLQPSCTVTASPALESLACAADVNSILCSFETDANPSKGSNVPRWLLALILLVTALAILLLALTIWYGYKYALLVRGSYELLCKAIPEPVARRLRRGEVVREAVASAVPVFGDIVGYTRWSERRSCQEVIGVLGEIFALFDQECEACGMLKVKTVGDCYMCVAGCMGDEDPETNLLRGTMFAWRCIRAMAHLRRKKQYRQGPGDTPGAVPPRTEPKPFDLHMRFGLCEGPVSAGVIGTSRLQYDLWGDTVNTAARMESSSSLDLLRMPHKDASRLAAAYPQALVFAPPEELMIKGKGRMTTQLLLQVRDEGSLMRLISSNTAARRAWGTRDVVPEGGGTKESAPGPQGKRSVKSVEDATLTLSARCVSLLNIPVESKAGIRRGPRHLWGLWRRGRLQPCGSSSFGDLEDAEAPGARVPLLRVGLDPGSSGGPTRAKEGDPAPSKKVGRRQHSCVDDGASSPALPSSPRIMGREGRAFQLL